MPVTGPIIAALVSTGVSGLAGAAGGILGINSGREKEQAAANIAGSNPRPVYNIPGTEFQNQSLLENRAAQGLSDQSINLYNQNNDRALTSGLNAILRGGGSANQVGAVTNNYYTGSERLAQLNDQQKVQNIAALLNQNNRLSDFQDKAFQVNQYAPYADKAQAAKLLQQSGSYQEQQGLGTTLGAITGTTSSIAKILGGL